jgi:hypothetical protein
MKALARCFAGLTLCVLFVGCKTAATSVPTAPGYITAQEQTVGEVIAGANAAVLKYEADVKAGTYTPTPAMKTAISALQQALVIADPLATAWHQSLVTNAAAPEPAQLATAVSTINTNIAALPGAAQ